MSIREIAIRICGIYFALVTLITVAIMVMGLAFDPNAQFGYDAFASPLLLAAVSIPPTAIMYSRHELSIREVLVRKVIQLVLIEALVLSIAFTSPSMPTNNAGLVAILACVIAVIFVLANAFAWAADSATARKLEQDLVRFQASE
ncbi:MAG: hypothetical protein J5804_05875 [Eggerthellaceae bacterium]|nr:hypothetical protein [Eggerthellaceae bacterium]